MAMCFLNLFLIGEYISLFVQHQVLRKIKQNALFYWESVQLMHAIFMSITSICNGMIMPR